MHDRDSPFGVELGALDYGAQAAEAFVFLDAAQVLADAQRADANDGCAAQRQKTAATSDSIIDLGTTE